MKTDSEKTLERALYLCIAILCFYMLMAICTHKQREIAPVVSEYQLTYE